MKNYAIILASGNGSRSGLDIPKQYYKILDKTILEYSIEKFEKNKNIDEIIVVTNPDYLDLTKDIISKNSYTKISKVISGGETRQESSYNGVFSIDDENANVLIHDAVRPLITDNIINACIEALKSHKAINVAIESSDTIIEVDENNYISNILDRKFLKRCQTPQCFNLRLIKKAHYIAQKDNFTTATDDCSLVLRYNLEPVYIVNGETTNIKVTYPEDIILTKYYLNNKENCPRKFSR